MILIYDKPNTHTVLLKKYGALTFFPGKNTVSKEHIEAFKKEYTENYDALINEGILKIFQEDDALNLSDLNAKQATEIIENIMSIEELEKLEVNEKRKGVLQIIEKQKAAINHSPEKKDK